MAEWSYVDTEPGEGFCEIRYFAFVKKQPAGDVEFLITLREYVHPPDPALKYFAQADKQTNQKTAPFTPVGWGSSVASALHECVKSIRRFPYEPQSQKATP
ncbi:MAG TPA: hypothetical protein VKX49_03925 [Bryobacteraceae bacterium]|nr:hypothetical protein [Bryobacteraceae bacterium]